MKSHQNGKLHSWVVIITFICLGIFLYSCHYCSLKGCPAGFRLHIEMEDGGSVPLGEYSFTIVVDDIEIYEQCVIDEDSAGPECTNHEYGSEENLFYFLVYEGPHFEFHAVYYEDPSDNATSGSDRGPEYVSIRIEFNNEVIGQDEYWPQYERVDDFWGEDCGYCDLEVTEQMILNLPE